MDEVKVEQLGGFAGFGGPHLESSGIVPLSSVSAADREKIDALFRRYQGGGAPQPNSAQADQFRYRLSRRTQKGMESIEAAESEVPEALRASVTTKIK